MKNTLFSIFMICGMLLIIGSSTYALFSDAQSIPSNNIETGIWNPGRATISEILYDPSGTDAGKEWIDIVNTGGYALDMTEYILHFDAVAANHYVFPSFTLQTGAKVRIHVKASGLDSAIDLYWPVTGGKTMANATGSIALFKSTPKNASTIVDFVAYGTINQDNEASAVTAGIWVDDAVVPKVIEAHSIKLIDNQDRNLISDWADNPSPA